MNELKQQSSQRAVPLDKQRSYQDVVQFLDANWSTNLGDTTLTCIKQLNKAFDNIAQKVPTILVGGTNGKSLTIHYTRRLLQEEGLRVGSYLSPHLLSYNERFVCSDELISQKTFTELANTVINRAEELALTPNSHEILTIMSLLYFHEQEVDVALVEVREGGAYDATSICDPKIAAITRITDDKIEAEAHKTTAVIKEMLGIVKPGTYVVSANQSKIQLQEMQDIAEQSGGVWSMPIRKVAPLNYPFEQLHGRCAALAERIADIFINTFANNNALIIDSSLLTKKKGRRGRPTLHAKRQAELNPKKTLEQFWREEHGTLPGRFQLLEKEKPTVLLDNASNLDAFKNLLLGIRLLHYQRPLKGLALILGGTNNGLDFEEFYKLLRYFFKKTSGHVIVCPTEPTPGHTGTKSWDVQALAHALKGMKVKTKVSKNMKEAYTIATRLVDDQQGLVVITGSNSVLTDFWHYKGLKKLS